MELATQLPLAVPEHSERPPMPVQVKQRRVFGFDTETYYTKATMSAP